MGHRFDISVELARLCARNKDGSFATQADRVQILHQAARTLQKAGFQLSLIHISEPTRPY